jgi:hypothetical protein
MFGQRTTFVFNNKYMHVDFGKCISKSSKQHKSQSLVQGIFTFENCFFTRKESQTSRSNISTRFVLNFLWSEKAKFSENAKKTISKFSFHIYTLNMYNQIALHDIKSHSTGAQALICVCVVSFQFIYFSVFILLFNWIITLLYTNMLYNNNTPVVEHIITTYKLICICMFFSLII